MKSTYSQELIDNTKDVWQPYYEEELKDSDAIEIISNWSQYLSLISERITQDKLSPS